MFALRHEIPFQKKHSFYLRTIKDLNLEQPTTFQIRIIRVRCPACKKPFPLPAPLAIPKHTRATSRSKDLALSLIVRTNGSLQTSGDVAQEFGHITIPRATLHRWKQSAAGDVSHREIIQQLNFSGILCIDEFRPKRERVFDLFASDRRNPGRILYLDQTEDRSAVSGATAEKFCKKLELFGIDPKGIIADMGGGIWKGATTVFPNALYQYDYFHVMQSVHEKLRSEIRSVWWKTRKEGNHDDAALLWDAQWTLLRNMEKWNDRDEEFWHAITKRFPSSMMAWIPIFKQGLRDIFDQSRNTKEAYKKRDAWIAAWDERIKDAKYLKKIVALTQSHLFPSMITYLDHRWLPRTTNAETMIRNYRHMEKARYGFGSIHGRQNHLKLYQLKTYLAQKVG